MAAQQKPNAKRGDMAFIQAISNNSQQCNNQNYPIKLAHENLLVKK